MEDIKLIPNSLVLGLISDLSIMINGEDSNMNFSDEARSTILTYRKRAQERYDNPKFFTPENITEAVILGGIDAKSNQELLRNAILSQETKYAYLILNDIIKLKTAPTKDDLKCIFDKHLNTFHLDSLTNITKTEAINLGFTKWDTMSTDMGVFELYLIPAWLVPLVYNGEEYVKINFMVISANDDNKEISKEFACIPFGNLYYKDDDSSITSYDILSQYKAYRTVNRLEYTQAKDESGWGEYDFGNDTDEYTCDEEEILNLANSFEAY